MHAGGDDEGRCLGRDGGSGGSELQISLCMASLGTLTLLFATGSGRDAVRSVEQVQRKVSVIRATTCNLLPMQADESRRIAVPTAAWRPSMLWRRKLP
jgi:hypothetical protein